ncbi:PREDICTED: V-set and transmembrane domain-containing protein 1-like [Elephantulus edwardii]|uniref:V-set and transmembrane domain-containing protein 1-like n=1 Tax=Elephantulus edwardii TaxID=28737 RepID=UPI0003F07F79|nr:PREDICTED: V-set and transmembrane domain-containing protein 1-like [Elephantulus edwardii]
MSPVLLSADTNGIFIAIFTFTFLLLFLLSVFFIYKYTRCVPTPPRNQKKWGQAERSQTSNAEEAHGVTYAEIDTRALSQSASDVTRQPLDTCVYSTVKA